MSERLRVLHVIPSLGPLRGGPSAMARAIAEGLAAAGVAVDVASTDDNGPGRLATPLGRPLVAGGVTYRYFPRQTRFYTGSAPLAAWLAANAGRYHVVHTHGLFTFAPLAGAAAAGARRVPYIVRPLGTLSPYGMARRGRLKRLSFALLDRRALAGAAAVHFTSEQERREAAALGAPHRAVVIPLPVAPPADLGRLRGRLRAAHPALAGQTVALFLARVDPKKGLDLLLPALAAARGRGAALALVVAGAGEERYLAELRAAAAGLGLGPGALVWAGHLDGEAKLAALADADLFVLPSYAENFGVAVVEALGAGLPVIVSDQVALHDEVAAAGAGVVVPCAAAPLADALAALAGDPARRAALRGPARALAARFAPRPVAERLLALYADIAAPPQRRLAL
jgi:glycosyltransferase involved in cell wall biosynthesis